MALIAGISDTQFDGKWGTVLTRYDASTGLWSVVGWCHQNDSFVEQLIPGRSYVYQIWLVLGSQGQVTSLRSTGVAKLGAIGAKK